MASREFFDKLLGDIRYAERFVSHMSTDLRNACNLAGKYRGLDAEIAADMGEITGCLRAANLSLEDAQRQLSTMLELHTHPDDKLFKDGGQG